jgi:hypothetical protein
VDAGPLITTLEQVMGPLKDLYVHQGAARSHSLKPSPAVVRQYENAVYAFRDQRVPGGVKGVIGILVDSLDLFESGRVLEAGRAVMKAIEQFEAAGKESEVTITPEQAATLGQFRAKLFKMAVPTMELNQKRIDL